MIGNEFEFKFIGPAIGGPHDNRKIKSNLESVHVEIEYTLYTNSPDGPYVGAYGGYYVWNSKSECFMWKIVLT